MSQFSYFETVQAEGRPQQQNVDFLKTRFRSSLDFVPYFQSLVLDLYIKLLSAQTAHIGSPNWIFRAFWFHGSLDQKPEWL